MAYTTWYSFPMDIRIAIEELVAAGWSETRIAEALGNGTKQPTINRIKRGKTKNPGFELGMAIIRLHEQVLGEEKQSVA